MHHGRPRALDWGCALLILGWGLALLAPGETLSSSPAYANILSRASEAAWGWLCISVGLIHAIALLVNGRAYEGMPIVRAFAAVIGATLWGQFAYGFVTVSASMGIVSLGIPATIVPLVLNLYCAGRAGEDAVHGRRARDGG